MQILTVLPEVCRGFTRVIRANIGMSLPFLPNRLPALSYRPPCHLHGAQKVLLGHLNSLSPSFGFRNSLLRSHLAPLTHPKHPAHVTVHFRILIW